MPGLTPKQKNVISYRLRFLKETFFDDEAMYDKLATLAWHSNVDDINYIKANQLIGNIFDLERIEYTGENAENKPRLIQEIKDIVK